MQNQRPNLEKPFDLTALLLSLERKIQSTSDQHQVFAGKPLDINLGLNQSRGHGESANMLCGAFITLHNVKSQIEES